MKKNGTSPHNEAFDPPISMTENSRYIYITVGLPGIAEEQIRIDLEKTTITVLVQDDGRRFRKSLRIPAGTRIFKKKFFGGVLEIFLEKPGP